MSTNRFAVFFSPMAQQPLVGQDFLIIRVSESHSDAPHLVGLLWMSYQPVIETSTWQHMTLIRDRHPCPQLDSLQPQEWSGHSPTLQTAQLLGLANVQLAENKYILRSHNFLTIGQQTSAEKQNISRLIVTSRMVSKVTWWTWLCACRKVTFCWMWMVLVWLA